MSATEGSARAGATAPLLEALLTRIAERSPKDGAPALTEFARAYTHRLSADELAGLSADELFGQVIGAFHLADARGTEPIAVRAFTPALDADGYGTAGTVVEVSTIDSPFLVDSLAEELQARGLPIRRFIHPVIGTERDEHGRISRILPPRDAATRESVMHFEIDRRLEGVELKELEDAARRILGDVQLAVRDFEPMRERVRRMIQIARAGQALYPHDEIEETASFLAWLLDQNFIFLGYREYELIDSLEGRALHATAGSGLGILSKGGSTYDEPVPLAKIEPGLRARIEGGDLLIYSKTNSYSTVHRRARMDYIGVRRVAADEIIGEARLVGLFTSKAYMEPAGRVPLLHRKLQRILAAEDLFEGSHDYRAAVSIFESFPKDELFAASTDELRGAIVGLLALQEQQRVRLFVRRDIPGRSVSLLVALPRDRFNAELRHRIQDLFVERLQGSSVDYHLSLGEADPAQIHFAVHIASGRIPDVDFAELEREVIALTRTWEDRLRDALIDARGEERGRELADRWCERFPDSYRGTEIELAVRDVGMLDRLESGDEAFLVGLQNEPGAEPLTRVGLYRIGGKIGLSDFMPILEALGLRVVEEVPTRLEGGDGQTYIHDFGVLGPDGRALDVGECAERVAGCIAAAWRGELESDSLNRLVVSAGLDWRQVAILRAYRKYQHRVNAGFPPEYKNDAFAANPGIAAMLVRLFEHKFDPGAPEDPPRLDAMRGAIHAALDAVASLDQDRILRGHLGLIEATVRTNVYLEGRDCFSFKLRSADVPDMPRPFPLYEIYVYGVEMEGVHLRGGKVARGGIRWSDRRQDFRTEVLGLMKAQMVKNAVIVPTGSKGGFVLKRPPADRARILEEVRRHYVTFMRGMLDLTDNLVDGNVVHPAGVRVLDEDDPYLVVAADKGTATFSDTANRVAEEYGYWLGDAFASGGSTGYDHKKLGITARGAWESLKRHFLELGVDPAREPFTAVGIGDMSGDVFGNGMLRSDHLKLVAAFDHRHVFLDPDPDPSRAFAERKRLFELPSSSWDDYDRSALSSGGGVWPRSAKSVELSAEAERALGVSAPAMPPDELIRAILRAPVDLLWNGGIGTYVKAWAESDAEAGDRANDAVRVNGRELRARVVVEGGNLGFTQRGRTEFAHAGGRINTDFIDNSGGVDCSDHEVNLKILLNLSVQRGELTLGERNQLLRSVADDVTDHVIYDNYLQAQIISQDLDASGSRLEAYEDLMVSLESAGLLDRRLEALPSTDEMADRRRAERGMTRPELAVLLAYAKISLVDALLRSSLPDDPYLQRYLRSYFPPKVVERFEPLLAQHPLRRELTATIISNDVVNSQGITFVSRMVTESGVESADVCRAYLIARDVSDAVERWDAVESLSGTVDPTVEAELMGAIDRLVEQISRWYLTQAPGADVGRTIEETRDGVAQLSAALPEAASGERRSEREGIVRELTGLGVPEEVARRHAFQPDLVHGPNVIAVARSSGRNVDEVARVFFLLGDALRIDWLESRLGEAPAASRWQRWAIQAMRDDLLVVRRRLAERALSEGAGSAVEDAVRTFLSVRTEPAARLERFMRSLAMEGVSDLAALTVAVRQIRALAG